MPRKATKKRAPASRKASMASAAEDASDVSSMVGDIANLDSLDEFDEKENSFASSKMSVAQKSKLQTRKVLAKTQLLRAFDMEVESRCKQLRLEAESLATGLKQSMAVWKVQLPSRVRTMKLSEFVDKYGGNINAIFESETIQQVEQLTTPLPRRSARITKQASRVTSSDAGAQVRSDLKTPQTATKTVQRSATTSSSSDTLPTKQLFTKDTNVAESPSDPADLEAMMRKVVAETLAAATTRSTTAAGKRGGQTKIDAAKMGIDMLKNMLAEYEKKLESN